jgi:hypothetical protein
VEPVNPQSLPEEVHRRAVPEFPGEADLALAALSDLADVATRGGHDVDEVLLGVLDDAHGDLVRFTSAIGDARRRCSH